MRLGLIFLLCGALLSGSLLGGDSYAAGAEPPLRVAVAANFRAPLERINAQFSAATGLAVVVSSGSTGTLATQILYGAPFDVFLAADSERPARLAEAGFADSGTQACYARGRLVLLGQLPEPAPIFEQLAQPQFSLAIASAETAPYGVAAEQVLARPEFLAGNKRKIVRGTNVLQAYQFYLAGATDLALVARSLSPAAGVLVPADWHTPIEQHAIVLRRGSGRADAERYLGFLQSKEAKTLIRDAGYEPCS